MNEGGLIGLSNGACTITNTSVSVDVYGSNAGGFVGINKTSCLSMTVTMEKHLKHQLAASMVIQVQAEWSAHRMRL